MLSGMEDFATSLVREKITFVDKAASRASGVAMNGGSPDTVIRSNRIYLKLNNGLISEKVVVRAQTMHVAMLLAAKVMFSHYRNGPFAGRDVEYDWDAQWQSVLSGYEKNYNPSIWAAVYINGAPAFKTMSDPYMDVVEKCAMLAGDTYDAAIGITEKAFQKAGKEIAITHDTNVAAVFTDTDGVMNCGIVHRAANHSQAFNFIVEGGVRDHRVVQCITASAAFLEGLNLSMVVKDLQNKVRMKEITPSSPEAGRLRAAAARMVLLNKTILSFEEMYDVRYRPGKPDIFQKE